MKSKDMNRRIITGLAVLLGAGIASQEAKADSLNILISPTGTDYYQWVIGTYTSPWQTQSSAPGSWDSMMTNPGGTNNAGGTDANIGNTQSFSISADSDLSYTIPGGNGSYSGEVITTGGTWRTNSANSLESSLIVTNGGPISSSTVQNLLVLDTGIGGIYLYKTPSLNGSGDVTNVNASGVNAYGYTGGSSGTWSQTSPPITQLGTLTSALEGDLQNNGGMAGNGNGQNFAAGAETTVSLPGGPLGSSFSGYEFVGGNNLSPDVDSLRELINGNFPGTQGYITPNIYLDLGSVPEPGSIGLLGLGAIGLLLKRRKSV